MFCWFSVSEWFYGVVEWWWVLVLCSIGGYRGWLCGGRVARRWFSDCCGGSIVKVVVVVV